MSRLEVKIPGQAQAIVEQLYRNMERRIAASPPGLCPVDMALNFLNLCRAQTCGKCVPCRIGLAQLSSMLTQVLDGEPEIGILSRIESTAQAITETADCAIGIDAANLVLMGLKGFRDDYEEHILHHRCLGSLKNPVPCVALCPAGVDIPGYIALVNAGRCDDAVQLIRKDNPFPTACAYICEHPCEARCRRNMVDNALNIRGLKRYAVDHATGAPHAKKAPETGKSVAIIGGGPGGLSAAYYLALMGHKVTVYEKKKQLGGMMRYGIPSYRLPRQRLDNDINAILSLGIEVHTQVNVGSDITFDQLKKQYDCLYLSIGAHTDKKTGIPGEDSRGVISAVELLRRIGDDDMPDFTGQNVVVIGGGNVAMDVTRSAIRLGAANVTCVYRRRQADMTAQQEEIEGAIAEGAEVLTLQAPVRIEADETGQAVALWTQPQIIGAMDSNGRPRPATAAVEPRRISADSIIVAIGQGIESLGFEQCGVKIQRGGTLLADSSTRLPDMEGVFAGGDCVTGPATVIRAIAAGKAAAANIDEYLGFQHEIRTEVQVPAPRFADQRPCGRVNATERGASERKGDFQCIECGMTDEEAAQESSRCLRCDHFGYGNFKGGRVERW
ncbi:NAD(P)-binding protein [Oscillibacter ruminantium]|jgi:NADPH-dependent glutamate synthase beta subunit-like oxidoreductase|uniref:NAD(P)-binding protein n=1 Tax=Oscillibacter ruminantium TaxID=1263547 RepID=UPI0002E75C5E|nr:NAD(P)-binding protein [Oscillibacter ruminantium]MDN0031546.1 NAD(P)-binding protein [Oscillibacter valericigenes]MEA5041315.1 NAD(P)-binding protein [Oscillibacter ruminantium]